MYESYYCQFGIQFIDLKDLYEYQVKLHGNSKQEYLVLKLTSDFNVNSVNVIEKQGLGRKATRLFEAILD